MTVAREFEAIQAVPIMAKQQASFPNFIFTNEKCATVIPLRLFTTLIGIATQNLSGKHGLFLKMDWDVFNGRE
jgi:hypothetical protein